MTKDELKSKAYNIHKVIGFFTKDELSEEIISIAEEYAQSPQLNKHDVIRRLGQRNEDGTEGDYCRLARCHWNDEYRSQLGCNNCPHERYGYNYDIPPNGV